jgi:hypothetical protein
MTAIYILMTIVSLALVTVLPVAVIYSKPRRPKN